MQQVILFAILGLGVGGIYSLMSQGLIAIYRGTGVLNFAQGAMGATGAYVAFNIYGHPGGSYVLGIIVGVLISAALGVLTHLVVMRPLRRASALVRVVASLGVLTLIQSLLIVHYGTNVTIVSQKLPSTVWHLTGTITVQASTVILLVIAAVISALLTLLYARTKFGLATTAVTENNVAAQSLGWSPDLLATANWALGAGLAGAATILVSPILQLQVSEITNVVLAAMAAALLAEFRSFTRALWAGLAIGILETEINRFVNVPDLGQAIPFVVVILWLTVTGRGLPNRAFLFQRLPTVGNGRIRWIPLVIAMVAGIALITAVGQEWQVVFASTFAVALILLSVVVVTGYAGQISLAQYTMAGVGAFIAGRLGSVLNLPFIVALIIGVVLTVPVGVLFAAPALRTRGISLAIVTLGLGSAIELVVFDSTAPWAGGFAGTPVSSPSLFGLSIDPVLFPGRYADLCLILYVVAALAIANIRRGRSGRSLLATRANERAAAALGISVSGVKLYAFAVASFVAALGGILLAFENENISFTVFTSFASITIVAYAVVGGMGYLWGPVLGATFVSGTVGSQLLNTWFPGLGDYIGVVGGGVLVFVVLTNQDGVASEQLRIAGLLRRRSALIDRWLAAKPPKLPPIPDAPEPVAPHILEISGVTVRFGGVTAVSELSFTARPGTVFGLIGPNGAGKTTAIDAITGFVDAAGSIKLNGTEIAGWPVARRARGGVRRTFQSLELFEDMTVLDNLRTACDDRGMLAYAADILKPANPPLPEAALLAIEHFRLSEHLTKVVSDLSYGERRLVAIARAVAARPGVLLLDEPAAGLGSAESLELSTLVRRLADDWGMTILLVEHDMEFVMSVCDQIAVMEFGAKIAQGRPAEIRKDPAVIAAYLGNELDPGAMAELA
jgi:ABC-type branched-subunit amino acid transport system ATPase component/ABC-type branched-subunit amino acid transport system permease subunit